MTEDDKIRKFLKNYLTQPKIKEDFADKILKQADHYASKNRPKQFLDQFFDTLRKSFDPKNPKQFVSPVKRFLFIINKLLGTEAKKEKQGKFNSVISEQIVRYYLFFFDLIFKHSLHELIVELKLYRMKWVKLISDHAFINIRQEVKKKHNNFNLDRGFSQENMEKLKKIHLKRGLTEEKSNFYLGLSGTEESKREDTTKIPQRNESSDSDSDEERHQHQAGNKKFKAESSSNYNQDYQPGYSSMQGYSNYPSYNQGYYQNAQSYENQQYQTYQTQRPRKPSFNQPYGQSQYPPQTTYLPEKPLDSTPQTTPSVYGLSPSRNYPTYFSHSNYSSQSETNRSNVSYEFKEVPETKKYETSTSTLQRCLKMRKEMTLNLVKCRECGECFETGENHQKHMNDHFFTTLDKANEAELKGKPIKKETKIKLLDIKNWESKEKSPENQKYQFQVLLSELSETNGSNVHCYFCNEEMEISFSQKYEDWVITDAIKINDEDKIDIIHFGCYESFKSDQNSPAQA